ncbi:MAG TPA: oligosaccharide flippase family protein [Steroidobacteraceae bacterium]|nr:oligosaccharide flippase family protein [Steroidobacteraceae bacterium]
MARTLTQLISWIGTVFVVRKLDSHAVGLFGIALVAYNFLSMLYDGTLTETLVQRYPADERERRAVFSALLCVGILTTAVMCVLSIIVASLVHEPAVTPLAMSLSAALMLTSLTVLPHAKLLRTMEFGRLAVIASLQAALTTATTVALAAFGAGVWSLALGMIAGIAVRVVALNVAAPAILRPTLDLAGTWGHIRFGGVLLADNLLWRWYVSLDTFLLGRWVGATSLGFYSLAQQVADLPLEKISTIVNDVSLPAYAELSKDRGNAAQLMLETIRTHATIGFALFWGLAAVAPVVVPLLFGARWDAAILPLMALATVAPLRLIGSVETPAMTGIGKPTTLLRSKLVVAPAMTVALVLGAGLGGVDGVALAWVLAFPVSYAVAFRPILRAIGISYSAVLQAIRGPAAAAGLMALAVYGSGRLWLEDCVAPVLALGLEIALGVLVYGVVLGVLDRNSFELARARAARLVGLVPK